MAKARPIPGIGEDDPFALAAAEIVAMRAAELGEQSADVLDLDDIERVHDMRVASRRLRAAIEVFWPCFPKAGAKAVLAEVKELADALGERRDRDVAIAMLGSFGAAMPHPDRRGIASLIEELEAEQLAANDGLAAPVEPDRLARLEAAIHGLAAAARDAAGPEPSTVAEPEEAGA